MRMVWCTVVAACVAIACARPPRGDRTGAAAVELHAALARAPAPGRVRAPRPQPPGPFAAPPPRVPPPAPRQLAEVAAAVGPGLSTWSGAASPARGPPRA